MKKLAVLTAALVLMGAAPAMAMNCCGGDKGKAGMCAKGGMAMNMKGKKSGGCCCESMSSNMSKRS